MAFDGDWEKREKEEQSSRRWMLGFAIFLWVGGLMWLTTPLVVFGLITILAGFWPFSGYWKAKKEYEERNEHKQKMMDAFCKAQKQVVVPQRRDLICEGKFYLWLENNVIKIIFIFKELKFKGDKQIEFMYQNFIHIIIRQIVLSWQGWVKHNFYYLNAAL